VLALRGRRDMEDGQGVVEDTDFARKTLLSEIGKQIVRRSLLWAAVLTAAAAAIPL
jgi:hypothetical protein